MSALLPADERSRFQIAVDEIGGPVEFAKFYSARDPTERQALCYHWEFLARPKQLPPTGRWSTWNLRAGRGFGKTRTGAEWARMKAENEAGPGALVAPTAADARDVMVTGPSGILAICPPWAMPVYESSKRRVTWPNGQYCLLFSAEEPDRLRGPQHCWAWCDEIAAWAYPEECWDMLQFGLRQGDNPQALCTSTPRGLKFLRELEKDSSTVTVEGTTYENADNLAPRFIERIRKKYEGTRLGLQEISAQILDDHPGALWKRGLIDAKRLSLGDFIRAKIELQQIVVALDPAVTATSKSNESGIVAVGSAMCSCNGRPELHGFVLEDKTDTYTPNQTCETLLEVYRRRFANLIVGETNQGGDWIESLLKMHAGTSALPYRGVHAKEGKRLRAEPAVALYEQGRVHHVGMFPKLEDQMCNWDPKESSQEESPDDIDALVHGLTFLMVDEGPPPDVEDSSDLWHTRR
jgi:phage terminase large subunit-like protein